MTTPEIASRLHQLVETGQYDTAYDELFHPDAVAYEPQLAEMGIGEVRGTDNIKQKVAQMGAGIAQLNSRELGAPIVTGTHIAFTNKVDATLANGNNMQLDEICLYEVKGGKIVSEKFIY